MRSSFTDWKKQSGEELIRSISPVPDEEGEFQDKFGQKKKSALHLETELQEIQGGCLLYMKARTAQTEPKFEQQRQIDTREGICARIELSENPAILAIYQHKYWWTRPAFPQTMGEIPPKSQLVLLKYEQRYVCVLAVCSEVYRGDLEGSGNGLLVRLTSNQNGRTGADALAAVLTFGTDPYECIRRAGKEAVKALGHPEMLRENKKYPEVFNWFGWCSWDAFYHEVNEAGLLQKVQEFKDKNIPARWVLIDDGWLDADLDTQLLVGMDAEKKRFPDGLGAAVKRMKQEGIPYVGVWHAVMGYWNGLQKNSDADRFFSGTTETLPDGRIIPKADAMSAFGFYDRWHQYLRSQCGIDFIKVDGQSSISVFEEGRKSYGEASEGIQKGLNASAALHFDNAVINCMGMGAEDVWHRPSSMITRTSDDFVPNVEHGFREHAIQNAYSSLWTGLFYVGDWDMFFSEHPENRQNGILRAIGGGPVYTSDRVGKSDPEWIRPLILSDGRVLRCDDIGLPTADCLFENPTEDGNILKIFNRKNGVWYLAAFNIRKDQEAAYGRIALKDIPGISEGNYIIYDGKSGRAAELSSECSYPVHLEPDEAAVYAVVPAQDIAVFGIEGKYIIGGTVELLTRNEEEVCVRILEEGDLVFFARWDVKVQRPDGESLPVEADKTLQRVRGCRKGGILRISRKQS